MLYGSADILRAAHLIRPLLNELLETKLAAEIDQELAAVFAQAESGQNVAARTLQLLLSQDATRHWLENEFPKYQSKDLRNWFPEVITTVKYQQIPNLVDCYVYAEIDSHVVVNRATTVEVILSKEIIELFNSATAKSGKLQVDTAKTLIVEVISKV